MFSHLQNFFKNISISGGVTGSSLRRTKRYVVNSCYCLPFSYLLLFLYPTKIIEEDKLSINKQTKLFIQWQVFCLVYLQDFLQGGCLGFFHLTLQTIPGFLMFSHFKNFFMNISISGGVTGSSLGRTKRIVNY